MSPELLKTSPILRQRLRAALFFWLWLPAAVIGSGLGIDFLLAVPRISPTPVTLGGGGLLLIVGLSLISWSIHDLTRLGMGTPSPANPCRRLVTTGSYQLCRHPMFLGYDLAAFGILLFIGSLTTLLASYPLMLWWQIHFLKQEEHLLAFRFTGEYQEYQTRVPFLLPLLKPKPQ